MQKFTYICYHTIITILTSFSAYGQNDSLRFHPEAPNNNKKLHRLKGSAFYQTEKSIGLVPEIQGIKNAFVGLGVSRANFLYGEGGGNGYGTTVSLEYNPFAKIIAPKINIWATGFVFFFGGNVGLNGIYYMSNNKGNFVLRPEIGLGMMKIYLNYGYNLFLNKDISGINKHTLTLSYYHTIYPWKKED
jgi:hypothetical protein